MSIVITPKADFTLPPLPLTKFRENSKDSIVYLMPSHTIEQPRLVTVTSELPTPRKGNAGTMKTTVNSRYTVNIAPEGEPENNVPVIVKLQTSFPVGTSETAMRTAALVIQNFLSQDSEDFDKLFKTGILPSD